jgi:hypothetical protein
MPILIGYLERLPVLVGRKKFRSRANLGPKNVETMLLNFAAVLLRLFRFARTVTNMQQGALAG